MQLDFPLALERLILLFLHIDLLVQDLVCEADYAPPEDISRHLIQLFGKLIEDSRATLAIEGAPIVVHEEHFLLSLHLTDVHDGHLLVLGLISASLLPHDDSVHP